MKDIDEDGEEYYCDTCNWCGRWLWSVPEQLWGMLFCSEQCEKMYYIEQEYQEALSKEAV